MGLDGQDHQCSPNYGVRVVCGVGWGYGVLFPSSCEQSKMVNKELTVGHLGPIDNGMGKDWTVLA